ncbi:hypothetical protein [Pseudoalteromonas mariniglutinosa]|uniref:hypothetical protein n=1 Tax=Pseudoalteromonas mariniglutinosa TaxID=206042 RepID=UPI003850B7A1
MKLRIITIVSLVVLSLSGCATSSYTVGKNFASENVSQIVKGKTTSEEMIALFGEKNRTGTFLCKIHSINYCCYIQFNWS